ncbi:MAG TPA: hypothetical protein VGW75_07030 [Solirubrobacteraceae bacterium]|jgi:hypothetical protein|nr:hypothetical protein [Solirubrobacteraceae bacterium]
MRATISARALREVLEHLAWNADQVGAALVNRTELDAESPHELGAQLGLV